MSDQSEYVPRPSGSGGAMVAVAVGLILLVVLVCGAGLLGWVSYSIPNRPIPAAPTLKTVPVAPATTVTVEPEQTEPETDQPKPRPTGEARPPEAPSPQ